LFLNLTSANTDRKARSNEVAYKRCNSRTIISSLCTLHDERI